MVRNPHAGQPFTTPDDEIAAALLDVSIPTLMLSLVHMSADPSLISGELRPAGLFLNEVQGYMSEEDKAAVRKIALEVIADYRDRGCPEPEPIDADLLQEMMQWLVCEPVPDEYVPMLLEEMELDGRDARATHEIDQSGRADFPVVGHRVQAYFQGVMDKYDVGRHVLWETEVTGVSWDDATATWTVQSSSRDH